MVPSPTSITAKSFNKTPFFYQNQFKEAREDEIKLNDVEHIDSRASPHESDTESTVLNDGRSLTVSIDFGLHQLEQIVVTANDEPTEISRQFCFKKGFSKDLVYPLAE